LILVAFLASVAWFSLPAPPPPRVLKATQITREKFDITNVLTDGSRLYVTESRGSNQFLLQTSVAGGGMSVIPTPFANVAISDISPDHSQLLVSDVVGTENDYPVWILPLMGGTPRRLGNVVAHWILWETGWAVWSPDGLRIAFAKDSSIYMANAQGTDIRKLVSLSGPATEISFSPDGAHLRFTVWSPQHDLPSIWEANSDGSHLHLLFPDWHGPPNKIAGAWSPDGRYYFFSGCDDNDHCNIWALREASGLFQKRALSPFQLTTGPMFFNGANPDGRTLLGSAWSSRAELVRYDSRSHEFVSFLGGMSASDLDFSKDGKWVAYVSSPDGTLWRSRVDGSERIQLTSSPVSALQPRWSPDGTQIAYVDNQAGSTWKIFLISARGGTPQQVLSENQNQLDPSWSPDGSRLVFGRVPWLGASGEKISIQIVDLNSKRVSVVPGSQDLFAPRLSPDGEHLAAVSVGNKKLLLFDFKTREWTKWIDEPGTVGSPAWSRDGKYIYYNNSSTKDPAYRRVRVGFTRSEFMMDLKSLNLGTSRLGPWSGMAPDGSALFTRNLSTSDLYSLSVELP
jgi:Tol biopolymer transport system component